MADQTPQNFENHAVFPKTLVIAMAVTLVGVIMAIVGLILVKSIAGLCLIGTGAALIGLGSIYLMLVTRGYVTKLQDRIIRTEMRLRLREILPGDLQGVIAELTMKQLIGLRFASDEEMPELVREVQAEGIQDATPIKKLVKDWQADHNRV